MSAITIDNELVHYEVLGRGRPVILLHGWANSWRYWIPSMQQLSMEYRVYALDLWGYGDSGKSPDKMTLDAHTQLLRGFMDKLGITKAAFVGHALGAAVAIRFASLEPSRIARLMVISPPVFAADQAAIDQIKTAAAAVSNAETRMARPPSSTTDRTVMSKPADFAQQLNERALSAASGTTTSVDNALPKFADLGTTPTPAPPATSLVNHPNPLRDLLLNKTSQDLIAAHLLKDTPDYDRYLAEAGKVAPEALRVSVQSFDTVNMLQEAAGLTMPMLLIHGEADTLLSPPGEHLLAFLSGVNKTFRCEVVPSVGHFPMLADPTNFHRLIMDFLKTRSLADIVLQKERWQRKVR